MFKLLLTLIAIILFYNVSAQNDSGGIDSVRAELHKIGFDNFEKGNYEEAILCFEKLAETDKDTLLVAARAFGYISMVYELGLQDSIKGKHAEGMQLMFVEKSIGKYPYCLESYFDRLDLYKYSANKEGEDKLIAVLLNKFSERWEVYFKLANHYIYQDYLWPGSEKFDLVAGYLKKVIELNPSDFNTYLLLSVAYIDDIELFNSYVKKMYELAPGQFSKGISENECQVQSISTFLLSGQLSLSLNGDVCTMLNITD